MFNTLITSAQIPDIYKERLSGLLFLCGGGSDSAKADQRCALWFYGKKEGVVGTAQTWQFIEKNRIIPRGPKHIRLAVVQEFNRKFPEQNIESSLEADVRTRQISTVLDSGIRMEPVATLPRQETFPVADGRIRMGPFMNGTRWRGVAAIVFGALISAWQMYEVHAGEHFTIWMVGGFIPVPVIALGALLILGGLLIVGSERK